MTQVEMLLGLMLALTVTACWQIVRAVLGMRHKSPEYARVVGRRMMLTTVAVIAIPVLIAIGRDRFGELTSLYAFLGGLVTVNAIWLRRIR